MRKIYVLILLLIAVPLAAQFDAHLTGHVLDEATGEHMAYVNVQLKGTTLGTVTDESGHYLLKDLPDHFQKDMDKGAFRDAGYIYGPTLPRTYFVGLALKI